MQSIGADITKISRFDELIKKDGFLQKYFTGKEQEYFKQRKFAPQTVAVNFAAKEAFAKAIKTGVKGFALKDIAVLRDENGAPYLELSDKLSLMSKQLGFNQFSVSLSHDSGMAFAVVLAT